MRGAREIFYEYILELHDRITDYIFCLVGCDGGMHVIAGEYCRSAVVLGEAGGASRLRSQVVTRVFDLVLSRDGVFLFTRNREEWLIMKI
ncbi:MAG: hypothetical protein NC407_01455, partial [Lachnoclostridium sp.]|nr:hypothetical protein [Lachnoclostridium sp.]